ncbi:SPW repeat protein [Methylorubrum extorquens]
MRTIDNGIEEVIVAGLSLVVGAGLMLAPWYFGFMGEAKATWNAWICGSAVAVFALLAIMQTFDLEEYIIAIVGVWTVAAPWLLDFKDITAARWTHVGFGLALLILAGIELWRLHASPRAHSA